MTTSPTLRYLADRERVRRPAGVVVPTDTDAERQAALLAERLTPGQLAELGRALLALAADLESAR